VNDEPARANGVIRVLIADDHELFRHGLEQALGTEADIEVVGEASNGEEAAERAAALAPDVVLMDVRMPGVNGVEAAAQIRDVRPDARIVMLTSSDDERDLFAAVRAGASSYLLKRVSIDDLAEAIRAAHRGEGRIDPTLVPTLLREFAALSQRYDDDAEGGERRLTEREIEVLRLVARGMSNKEIASELVIAENTAKNHVRNILEKLRLRSRTEAATYAVRERLIS
jgi:two-component system NarL family response regulator